MGNTIKKRGGIRVNAGRPKKYTCDVKKVLISVPVDAIPAIKKYINKQKILFTSK